MDGWRVSFDSFCCRIELTLRSQALAQARPDLSARLSEAGGRDLPAREAGRLRRDRPSRCRTGASASSVACRPPPETMRARDATTQHSHSFLVVCRQDERILKPEPYVEWMAVT